MMRLPVRSLVIIIFWRRIGSVPARLLGRLHSTAARHPPAAASPPAAAAAARGFIHSFIHSSAGEKPEHTSGALRPAGLLKVILRAARPATRYRHRPLVRQAPLIPLRPSGRCARQRLDSIYFNQFQEGCTQIATSANRLGPTLSCSRLHFHLLPGASSPCLVAEKVRKHQWPLTVAPLSAADLGR